MDGMQGERWNWKRYTCVLKTVMMMVMMMVMKVHLRIEDGDDDDQGEWG